MNGPASETSTPWLRGLRRRPTVTGTGFAQPKKPQPDRTMIAGTSSVPIGSTWRTGFRLSRPARFAVSSPNADATQPCEISWRISDGIRMQNQMISVSLIRCDRTRMTTTATMATSQMTWRGLRGRRAA